MFGLWCVAFGQDAEAFWRATPAQWEAIYDAWLDENAAQYLIGGTITSAIANANRRKGSRALAAHDIFPHLRQLRRIPSRAELIAKAKAAFGYKPPKG